MTTSLPLRTRTGAHAAAEVLRAWSVETVFGVPGGHNLPLFAAAEAEGIESVGARHEQGAGFLAEAFGRLDGMPAVVVATAGPGIARTLTPLAQAESVPLCVLMVDDTPAPTDAGGSRHAGAGLRAAVAPFAEWIGCATGPHEVGPLVDRALHHAFATSRPAVVHLPGDMLTGRPEAGADTHARREQRPVPPDHDRIAALAELLEEAERVVLYAGAGTVRSDAQHELRELAAALDAPVVTTIHARGAVPDDDPLALGPVWDTPDPLDAVARAADLVVCLGTSLSPQATRDGALPLARTAHVDIDPARPGHSHRPELTVTGDVGRVLRRLLHTVPPPRRPIRRELFRRWAAQQAEARRERFAAGAPRAHELLTAMRAATDRETVFVCDMTALGYWAQRFLPVYRPGGLLSPHSSGTPGYGVPAAVGASLAVPDAPVVAVCGNAGFLMNCQEMAMAALHGLSVQIIVVDDGGPPAVHADGRRNGLPPAYVRHLIAPSLRDIAAAYGWQYRQVPAQGRELSAALTSTRAPGRSALIEITLAEPLPAPYGFGR